MPLPPDPAPAARFALLIDTLCRAIAAHSARHRLAGPVLLLLWSWLRRTAGRFARLAVRVEAGRPSPARRRPAAPRPPRARTPRKPRLPEGFAWVVRLVPEAASSASQLQYLLADPQMAALIEAAPTAGRLLRPLCRMLGVRPPPGLTPPRPAAPRPARHAASSCAAPPPDLPPPAPGPRPHVTRPRRSPPARRQRTPPSSPDRVRGRGGGADPEQRERADHPGTNSHAGSVKTPCTQQA